MKLVIRAAAILMMVSIAGCGQDDKPVKTADSGVLKTQRETLEQAKQVEQVVQDAAEQQRQKIEAGNPITGKNTVAMFFPLSRNDRSSLIAGSEHKEEPV